MSIQYIGNILGGWQILINIQSSEYKLFWHCRFKCIYSGLESIEKLKYKSWLGTIRV